MPTTVNFPLSNSETCVADFLLQGAGDVLAEEQGTFIVCLKISAARQNFELLHQRRIGLPTVHHDGVAAELFERREIDQAGRHVRDARNLFDLFAELCVQHAGQALFGAALLHDDGHVLTPVDVQKGLLGTVGDSHQGDHRADRHGHADNGQAGAHGAPHHVFQNEGIESHAVSL